MRTDISLLARHLVRGATIAALISVARPAGATEVGAYRGPGCDGREAMTELETFLGRKIERTVDALNQESWVEMRRSIPWIVKCWADSDIALTLSVPMLPRGNAGTLREGADGAYDAIFVQTANALVTYGLHDAVVRIGETQVPVADKASFDSALPGLLAEAGYPAAGEAPDLNKPLVIAILTALVLLVTMVYGPIAALLVELFPARIRYTALSLPYHIGNGWFGGFLPTISFAVVAATGDIYAGLWYPIGVAVLSLVVGLLFLPETFRRRIDHGGTAASDGAE